MARTWQEGDSWWRVGKEPAALLRLGAGGPTSAPVREVVLVHAGPEQLEELVGALACAVGMRLRVNVPVGGLPTGRDRPAPIHQAILPWPASRATTS
jgi:hypothetical protein